MGFDFVIRGATVVTPGHREVADIGIAGDRIAQFGGTMTGTQELAAEGLLAIPGGVDAHTHLVHQGLGDRLEFPVWVDDFWSGSRAAIAGGITTIGNMTYPVPDEEGTEETPSAAITREMAGAAPEAAVDWFLHPILLHPAALPAGEVAALAGGGHASIKMFLSDPDLAADEPALLAAASAAKAAGSVTLLHCEDGAMLRQAGDKLIAEGRGAVANFPDARPVAAEVAAVDQAIGIARRTGARVYIVHLSSAAALDRCRRARAAGVPVYVETRPLYLHLTRARFAEPDAGKYAGAPPLREASDREALWAGLAAGDIDTVCSDHAPWTLDAKLDPVLNAVTARQGVADLETLMPMLYSEGVAAGRISLDQFVDVTSANAARIFGLYPRKGAIAVGSDADIALWDPGHRRTIDGARMQSLSGYSVYDGWQVQGWPRFVVRRGQLVLADGEITARPGEGEWLRRNGTAGMLPSPAQVSLQPGRKRTGISPATRPTIGRMPSYEPVDLSACCNAGVEVLGDEPGDVPLGRVDLRGLPFLIGPEPPSAERCFLLPGAPTSVRIGRVARRVIVAHRLLEPGAPAGHAVGQAVAEYAFHLAGGEVVVAPIRERFEIQVVPPVWGRLPFLAVTDTSDYNLPRFEGKWGAAGERLAEHHMGWPAGYYLWCWENPYPERPVEQLEFIPRGGRFVVAGITTSKLDEYPFVREPARPVRLVTKDGRNGDFDVEVDRGVATYPQPLPGADDRAGWGAAEGTSAYASIAALPSATVAVRQGGTELGRVRWGDVERDGRADAGQVVLELAESGRNWVHVRVVDDATGRPVPCRVHFRSAEGIPYQPHGHHNHVTQNLGSWHYDVGGDVRLGQRSYAYIDGTCQGWLPRGDVVVDVARGFEYEPLRQTVRIEPGQRELTLRIGRVADMASEGWWSGDSHVHFLSTPGAQLEQRGEDLRVVNVLQTQWGALFTNTEDFSGRPAVVDGGGYVTYVGQENRQHALGHMVLWGLKEPVMPWCSDGPDEAELGGALDATLSDWADRTHAQGGTVVAAHFPNPNGEPAVLVATGRADAVEMLAHSDDAMLEYYRYLNSGYRLPLVGGTDKMSSAVPVGLYRTYARLDEEFSYEAWCRAVRSGRTFLSGGPLVTLSVDGCEPGGTVGLSGPGTVSVRAAVRSVFPLRSLEIVRNGEVVARAEANGGRQAEISKELRIDGNSWIACRAFGVDYHLDEWGRRVFAHTSPVYVACGGGDWTMTDPEGIRYIRTLVEGAREYVRHTAVRRSDQLTTHHHGEADHLAWLERPFAEALRALEERGRS